MTDWSISEDLDPMGDPYGVRFEPDDPESSWEDRRAELRVRHADRWEWFSAKAKRANRRTAERGVIGVLTPADVAAVFDASGGRCHYCGSVADQPQPVGSWQAVGRRVGSIDHIDQRGVAAPWIEEGAFIWNCVDNIVWCCMWCNTYQNQRAWRG